MNKRLLFICLMTLLLVWGIFAVLSLAYPGQGSAAGGMDQVTDEQPDIVVEAPPLQAELTPEQTTQITFTISNNGTSLLAWQLRELNGWQNLRGSKMDRSSTRRRADDFSPGADPPSTGPAPQINAIITPGDPDEFARAMAGVPAYAVDIYPGYNLVFFESETPDPWTVVAGLPGNQYFGGDFLNGDFSKLYVVDYALNQLHTVDTQTGEVTVIGSSVPGAGEAWTGLAAAWDGTLYGSASTCYGSTLYTVDPESGDLTTVGPITNGDCVIDIAVNADGEMYAVDVVDDRLMQIDPLTGAGTDIGYIGFNANYAQGMDFEEDSGTLFLAAFNGDYNRGELRIADLDTGNTTLVGAFPGGAEVDAFSFLYNCRYGSCALPEVPWLSESPITGTLSAGESRSVVVTFDSSGMELGQYGGRLFIDSNDADEPEITLPVTLTVVELGVDLEPELAEQYGQPGATVTYTLSLTNTGTFTDTFIFGAAGNLWDVTLPPSITLGVGEGTDVSVLVAIPGDAVNGETDGAAITAASQDDPAVQDTSTLTTTAVIEVYGIDINPEEAGGSGSPGEQVQYTLTLTNLGNLQDTIEFDMSGNLWGKTLPPPVILEAGESADVIVGVSVPADAQNGDFDTAIITATSQGDPAVDDTSTLTTTAVEEVEVYRVYLPLSTREYYNCKAFFDDFSDPYSGWWVEDSETVLSEYLNGEFRIMVKPTNYSVAIAAPACGFEDYRVEVDARWGGNSGSLYGLIFGVDSDFEQFYAFLLNTDYYDGRRLPYELYRYGPDGWVELAYGSSFDIHGGAASNHLEVSRQGDFITMFVNGSLMAVVTDSAITGFTYTGLMVISYTDLPNADARFDNFNVFPLGLTSGSPGNSQGVPSTVSSQQEGLMPPQLQLNTGRK